MVKKTFPKLKGQDLYRKVISTRPGYSLELANEIVLQSKRHPFIEDNLKFWHVVHTLIGYEYTKRTGLATDEVTDDLLNGVREVIGDDI